MDNRNDRSTYIYTATGHPIITSFEHGENWFYDYRTGDCDCVKVIPKDLEQKIKDKVVL